MLILYLCATFIIAWHLMLSYMQYRSLCDSLRWLQKSRRVEVSRATNTLYLLIPVFQEQKVIAASVHFFKKLADQPHIRVIYVTSANERSEISTYDRLKQLVSDTRITVIACPRTSGHKAAQVNYAIKNIATYPSFDEGHTYFGIYDVDSRPDVKALDAIASGTAAAYQQPSIDIVNYHGLSRFQRAGALLQIKWELAHNLHVLRTNLKLQRPANLQNAIGHGLFIRADVFRSTGNFQENITEDTEYGYRLAFNGIAITPLPYPDFVQYNPSTVANVPQISRWYSGEHHLLSYYRAAPKSFHMTFLVGKRYFATLKWAFGPFVLILALGAFIHLYILTALFIVTSVYIYIYAPFKRLSKAPFLVRYISTDNDSNFLLLCAGVIRPFFNSLGPLYFYLDSCVRRITRKEAVFHVSPKSNPDE